LEAIQTVAVLLVEDSAADAELTLGALREQRLCDDIEWVKDGVEALDYLHGRGAYAAREATIPRLVLMDLKLPRMDGFDLLRTMKQDATLRGIPVVMLTSSAEESDLLRSYELGVNSYVVKPVDFEAFHAEIRKLGCYWLLTNRVPDR